MQTTHKFNPMRTRWASTLVVLLAVACLAVGATQWGSVEAANKARASKQTVSMDAAKAQGIAPSPIRLTKAAPRVDASNPFEFRAVANLTTMAMMNDTESISVTAMPGDTSTVNPGSILTYVITVTNGSGAEVTPSVTFNVPQNTSFVSLTNGGGAIFTACSQPTGVNRTITCTGLAFLANTSGTFTLVVAVNDPIATPTAITFSATYSDLDNSGVNAKVSNTVTHNVQASAGAPADMEINKIAVTAVDGKVIAGGTIGSQCPPVAPGSNPGTMSKACAMNAAVSGTGEIQYQLAITNNGPNPATGITVQDVVPANTVYVPNSLVTPNGWTCDGDLNTPGVQPPTPGLLLVCAPPGSIAVNAKTTITYNVSVPSSVANGTIIMNTAGVYPTNANPVPTPTPTATPTPNGRALPKGIPAKSAMLAGTTDPNHGNDVSLTAQTLVTTQTDLGITKQVSNPTPVAGGAAFAYTLTVTNYGPSDAVNVLVTDPLPAGLVLANSNIAVVNNPSVAGYGLVCTGPANGTNGTVTCTGNMPGPSGGNNSTSTITLVVQAIPDLAGGVRTNSATVASDTQEVSPNVQPNTASVQVNIQNDASISISKTAPAAACAGDTLNYDIAVTNSGNSSAVNVVVTDVLPVASNAGFLSVKGLGAFANTCSYNTGTNTVTCTAGFLPTGTHHINLAIKTFASTATGPLTNSATLAAAVGTITGTNPATGTTTISHCGDLALVKTAPDSLVAGSVIDYKLKLTNLGISDLTGIQTPGLIQIVDALPAQVTSVISAVAGPGEAGGFTCTTSGTGPFTVTCLNAAGAAGNFPVNATTTITIKVTIDSAAVPGTNIQNCATVSVQNDALQNDPNSGNNTSCDSSVVASSADLSATKSAVPVVDPDGAGALPPVALPIVGPNVPAGSVNAGGYIRYDIPFGNNGPSDATSVLITDQIPGNTAFVGALATGGAFTSNATFTIQAGDTVAPLGPNVNLACTVLGNAGSQALYCRPEGNTGLNPAYADGTLPSGYNGTVTFFVKVNESVAGGTIVSNPANITSGLCPNANPPAFPPSACAGTSDPNTGNNTTLPTQTVVIASSNLTISKTVQSAVTAASNPNQTGPIGPATAPNGTATTGTAVLPGTYLTYRITLTNNGPSDVSNIRLTDVLPSGLEVPPGRVLGAKYVSVTPVLGSGATLTCAAPTGVSAQNNPQGNGGSIACTAPTLSANSPNNTASIDVTVFIDPSTKASLIDTATFDATINNFNRPVSGSTTLTTPVAPTSDLALTKTHTNAAGVVGGPVTAGTTFTYTITATNNGPSTAQMYNLVDTLPAFEKVTKIEVGKLDGNGNFVTPNAKDGNLNPTVSCSQNDVGNWTTSVTCTASELPPNKKPDNTVNPAGTFLVRLTVYQDQLTPQPTPTSYSNCVTATSMSTDPISGNNTNICDTVPVVFRTLLTGTKTDSPDPVIAGNNLTYTITATPKGPSAAFELKITDALPTGTVFLSAVASAGATVVTPAVNANGTVTATWDGPGGTDSIPGGVADGLTPIDVTRTLTIVVRVCPDFQQILSLTDAQMCTPNLTNTAVISSLTPDTTGNTPNQISISEKTTVQAQSDLQISKTGPATAVYSTSSTPSNITYTLSFQNNGPSNSSGTKVVDVLPKGFRVVGTPTSSVPGMTFTTSTVDGIQTVTFDLGVLGAANQCQLTRPISGTITIVANVPIKHPTITVTNTATISTTNCLADPNLANNTATWNTNIIPPPFNPGLAYPALSEASDMKEGSILFYPIYTSDAANGNTQNTRISITNTSPTERVIIHLFAVDGASCSVLDSFLCLTPNQTSTFLASDFDPGNTGYLVAVAVESDTGLPRAFNELIGDEFVKFSSGHQANLGAEAVAATMMFPGGVNPNVTSTVLRFDGMSYNRLPRVLAADNLFSPVDGNSTMLIVNRIGGNFATTGASIGNINGLVYDDAETSFSFTANPGSCQLRSVLSNSFPRTFTPFSRVIPAGRTGWMKFWTVEDRGLLGAVINFNASANASSSAFNQGHNLHHLTLTDTVTITVPVFIPSC